MRAADRDLFTEWWPAAEKRLRSVLGKYDLSSQDIDDVVQTTAERALTESFNDSKHLVSWAVTVAKHLVTDEWRRARRLDLTADVAPLPAADDVFDEVDARVRRDAMLAAIAALSPEKRRTLAGDDHPADRAASVRFAVRRHRIRSELRDVWNRLGVTVLTVRARLALRRIGAPSAEAAAAIAIAVSSVAGVVGAGSVARHEPTRLHQSSGSVAGANAALQEPTLARPPANSAPADSRGRVGSSTPDPYLSVVLGHAPNGTPIGFDVRPQAEEERGVLYCDGLPSEDPNAKCIYYPPIARAIFHAIDGIVPL